MLSDTAVDKLRASIRDDTFASRFDVVREAGAGGMGRVFEAIERATGRRVGIKILTRRSPEDHARFSAEAEILERLDHPAIVRYVGHGVTSEGESYIAMSWLDGEPLGARLRRGKLSVAEATALGARIAKALDHAHDAGVIHRDVKPSNVFLVDGDPARAVLIDFGIAKGGDARDLTSTGQLVGTPGYMAPEQALGRRKVDARVDLFALGSVLYEALSGQAPFGGEQVIEVLARVLMHDPPLLDGVPRRLATLVQALLAKQPEQRHSDAGVVAAELDAIHVAVLANYATVLEASPFAPTLVTPPRRSRAHALVWSGGVVAALGAGIAIGALALRDDPAAHVVAAPDAAAQPAPAAPAAPAARMPSANAIPVHAPGGLDGKYLGYQEMTKHQILPVPSTQQTRRESGSMTVREQPDGTLRLTKRNCSFVAKREGLRAVITADECSDSIAPWKMLTVRGTIEFVPDATGKVSLVLEATQAMAADIGPTGRQVHTEVEFVTKFVGDRPAPREVVP